MKQEVASFLDYVAHAPTVFQATQQACDMLIAAGFAPNPTKNLRFLDFPP